MENLSWYVYITFDATVLLAVWLFMKATNYSKTFLVLVSVWILLQSALGISGFYSNVHSMTDRFPLLFLPPLLLIVSLFITTKGKSFVDGLHLPALTIFHVIRITVEITLFCLFISKSIPRAMTFEGRNFDILSGLSAPLIYYFVFVKKIMGKRGLLAWNIACILLLFNVVSNAILSLPARFQQFGFEQPNIALGYFPFLLLPAFVVPLALFANLAAIRQLLTKGNPDFIK
jgi:hypothetical protein